MHARRRWALGLALLLTICSTAAPVLAAVSPGQVRLARITGGFTTPAGVTNADDGTNRLFVVEQGGYVRVVKGATIMPTVFLDLHDKVLGGLERGLLSIAFDPDFRSNRHVFAYYTRKSDGAIVVSRFITNSAGTVANVGTERILLVIPHPTYGNHNGGGMAFGPDGYLYLGVGDGGGSGDPDHHAQDKNALLGKILRIDVDGTGHGPKGAYGIPPTNPFVGKTGADEVWAYGLRNPWRITFDRSTGALWIGDVGQGRFEEIDRQAAGAAGGRNYGWPILEGNTCYGASTCNRTGLTAPIVVYSHSLGCSVTGGYVYRGHSYGDLVGQYLFGDYCSGRLWTVPSTGAATVTYHGLSSADITSFGESETGEVYLTSHQGALYRVIAP
jgi:glucose/arabinose dehydrogenase